jgi:hypothetical protein
MSHQPRRDDEVAAWLKAKRNEWYVSSQYRLTPSEARARTIYTAIDDLLDDYRLHADTGTPLNEHVSDGGHEDIL